MEPNLSRMFVIFAAATALVIPVSAAGQNDIKLPMPSFSGQGSVEAAIVAKKTVRNYAGSPMTLAQVSQILWSANGNLPADAVSAASIKVVPSAGGLYPLEVFLVSGKNTVTDLPEGVYLYKPQAHSLSLVASGDLRTQVAHACLSQMWLARAPVIVVIAAAFARTTSKYGQRGIQYVFMESGNSNQNVYLQAQSLGLQSGTVGAFNDNQVSAVLKMPKDVTPLLVMAVGK